MEDSLLLHHLGLTDFFYLFVSAKFPRHLFIWLGLLAHWVHSLHLENNYKEQQFYYISDQSLIEITSSNIREIQYFIFIWLLWIEFELGAFVGIIIRVIAFKISNWHILRISSCAERTFTEGRWTVKKWCAPETRFAYKEISRQIIQSSFI